MIFKTQSRKKLNNPFKRLLKQRLILCAFEEAEPLSEVPFTMRELSTNFLTIRLCRCFLCSCFDYPDYLPVPTSPDNRGSTVLPKPVC